MNQQKVKIVVGNSTKPTVSYLPHEQANNCIDSARAKGLKVTPIDGVFYISKKRCA